MTDRKHTSETAHLAKDSENPLTHQERVYFEMFRAIELLGRKLEKSENIREDLSSRLKDLESSAARDADTGKYYLPARIEPAGLPTAPEAVMGRRMTMGAALAGLAFGIIALALVLLQQAPQTLSPRQIAVLNTLTDGQHTPLFADNVLSGSWHKVVEKSNPAPVPEENVTAEVTAAADSLPTVQAAAAAPQKYELAAALERLQAVPPAASAAQEDALDTDLSEEMAQGDTDSAEEEGTSAMPANVVAEQFADAVLPSMVEAAAQPPVDAAAQPPTEPAASPVSTETVAAKAPVPEKNLKAVPAPPRADYTAAPPRDRYLPSIYADLENRAYDGIGEAQHDLAALYAAGGRVRPDYPRAVYWFRRAADTGIANASYNLGVMAQQGLGMAKDMQEAFAFYSRAARLGHPEAMYNLGLAYIEGRGTEKDNLRGVSYFKKAANAGLTQAAYNLGVIYEGGTVAGRRDLSAALEWYHVAAVEGHRDAEAAIRRVEKLQMQAEALSVADKVEPASGE